MKRKTSRKKKSSITYSIECHTSNSVDVEANSVEDGFHKPIQQPLPFNTHSHEASRSMKMSRKFISGFFKKLSFGKIFCSICEYFYKSRKLSKDTKVKNIVTPLKSMTSLAFPDMKSTQLKMASLSSFPPPSDSLLYLHSSPTLPSPIPSPAPSEHSKKKPEQLFCKNENCISK